LVCKGPLVKLVKMKFPTVNQGFVQGFPNLSLSNCLIVLFSPQNSRLFTRHWLRFPTAGRTSAEARISCNLRGLRCEDSICLLSDDRSLYDRSIAGSLIRLKRRQPEVLINPARAPKHGFNLQLFVHVVILIIVHFDSIWDKPMLPQYHCR